METKHTRQYAMKKARLSTETRDGETMLAFIDGYMTAIEETACSEILDALRSIVGIEVWIADTKMKEHFQSKVYSALEKATKINKHENIKRH